ncbi:MAG TPA: MarR family transcriptional regulator [Actinomycetota bacterium]|nr:MarR family transcriptional regulator [Actinomycetota bacterium]
MSEPAGREAWRAMLALFFSGQAHERMQEASAAVGLAPGVMKTLLQLEPGDGVPLRDLADYWRCDASYVTSVADALEERGLAVRRPHATDRRIKMLVLTADGIAARERASRVLHEPPPSFGALTVAEQRQLRGLLRKVADADAPLHRERPAAVR